MPFLLLVMVLKMGRTIGPLKIVGVNKGGFFRIRRGVDEVGIESHMTGWNKQIDENLQL